MVQRRSARSAISWQTPITAAAARMARALVTHCRATARSAAATCPCSVPPIQQIEDHPPPPLNSYGIKEGGGSYAIFLVPYAVFSVETPLILRNFDAIRTPIVWHVLGTCFANMGCGGGQNCFRHVRGSLTYNISILYFRKEVRRIDVEEWKRDIFATPDIGAET